MSHASNPLHYGSLAKLLEYPDCDFMNAVEQASASHSPATDHLREFASSIKLQPAGAIEEIYTRTFDLAPLCSPCAGVHLFGDESFKRASLMAGLRESFERASFDAGTELPDHAANLLRFMEIAPAETRAEIDRFILRPALRAMRDILQSKQNVYASVVDAALQLLKAEFGKEAAHA